MDRSLLKLQTKTEIRTTFKNINSQGRAIKQQEIKEIQIVKEAQPSLFVDDMIIQI